MPEIELYLLITLMIVGALVAVHTRYLVSAVISLAIVGLALAVAFLYMQAPDIAITQIVVEVLALVILIIAVSIGKEVMDIKGKWEILAIGATVPFVIIFGLFAYRAISELPPFGSPLMRVSQHYIQEGLKQTGSANLVTSVLLDFRAYDTLGEATILFTAILGTLAILRKVGRKGK
jgi:multisubunit Na+/H+ antiporter MnhB subunit